MGKKIGVLGAGSWGVTLANLLFEKDNDVTLWEFNPEQAAKLGSRRVLSFFPHITLPEGITVTSDLTRSTGNKDFLIFVVPSHTLRETANKIAHIRPDLEDTVLVTAVKGIENNSLKRMSEIIAAELPGTEHHITALSGPSHAEEVSKKIPTAITAASVNPGAAKRVQDLFMTSYFRVYTHSDIIGVETGAALKNVFAIAAGISDGLGLGDNTKAALVTRGMRELIKLGVKMGGDPSTFFGLTGLGDMIVTAFSKHSRNRALGEKIGAGKLLSEAEKEIIMIAEGVRTAISAYKLGLKFGLDLPIIREVYRVLYEGRSPEEAVRELMLREAKPETIAEMGRLLI